jgi:arylsulfatase A-like enzyme
MMGKQPSGPNARGGAVMVIAAAVLGFVLAEMVILIVKIPALLQTAHLSGLATLGLSALILYAAVGILLGGFWCLFWIIARLLRLRLSGTTLALLALVLAPIFLYVQERLQERMLGMYISLKSPFFYVPTLITLALTVALLVLLSVFFGRVKHAPAVLRRILAWPWLTVAAFGSFILLTLISPPQMNILGVFSEDEQRAVLKQHPALDPAPPDPAAPNFVVIMTEATRSDMFTEENAPFLWNLSRNHVYFSHYYDVSSATRPSVTSFFTSLYPAQHGCYNLALTRAPGVEGDGPATVKVADTIVSLPRLLQQRGYRTIEITSNTLAADPAFGFEDVFHHFNAIEPYRFQLPSFEAFVGFDFLKANLRLWRIFKIIVYAPEHSPTYFDVPRVNQTVRREMERDDLRPFFLYIHYMEPHSPYYFHPYRPLQINLYSPSLRDKILTAYQQEIQALDRGIAELYGFLDQAGLLNNTYLFITSDHGEEFYDHRNWGHGKSLYPEVIHVPAILVAPDGSANRRVEEIVESIDVAPTLAELAGASPPEFWEGKSLAPLLGWERTGNAEADAPDPLAGIAFSQFHDGRVFWASAVTPRGQVLFRGAGEKRRTMLFDLARDPLAQDNLAGEGLPLEGDLVRLLEENLARLEATAEFFGGDVEEIDPRHLEQLRALGYVD